MRSAFFLDAGATLRYELLLDSNRSQGLTMTRVRSFAVIAIVLGLGLADTGHGMESADLSVSSTATPNPVNAGGTLVYSIQITNHGPALATGVTLQDTLSPGVIFASSSSSQGACAGTTIVRCDLGAVAAGTSATVTINVTPVTPSVIENTAQAWAVEPGANPAQSVTRIWTSVLAAQQALLTITIGGTGMGQVSGWPAGTSCQAACVTAFPSGTQVTLTAAAAPGSVFAGWSGDCEGTSVCALSLSEARTVIATFNTPQPAPLLVIAVTGTGTGTVSSWPMGIDCQRSCSSSYLSGTLVSLTAVAQTGSQFAGWLGPCTGTAATCTLTLTNPQLVTATFNILPGANILPTPPSANLPPTPWVPFKTAP